MWRRALLGSAVLALACTPTGRKAACGDDSPRTHASLPSSTTESSTAVVMTLQTREHEVTVYGGEDGLRFSVALHASGALLADRIGADELERDFPGIHQHFRTAFADEAGDGPAPTAWAGI